MEHVQFTDMGKQIVRDSLGHEFLAFVTHGTWTCPKCKAVEHFVTRLPEVDTAGRPASGAGRSQFDLFEVKRTEAGHRCFGDAIGMKTCAAANCNILVGEGFGTVCARHAAAPKVAAGVLLHSGRETYNGVGEAIEVARWLPKITDTDLCKELTHRGYATQPQNVIDERTAKLIDERDAATGAHKAAMAENSMLRARVRSLESSRESLEKDFQKLANLKGGPEGERLAQQHLRNLCNPVMVGAAALRVDPEVLNSMNTDVWGRSPLEAVYPLLKAMEAHAGENITRYPENWVADPSRYVQSEDTRERGPSAVTDAIHLEEIRKAEANRLDILDEDLLCDDVGPQR